MTYVIKDEDNRTLVGGMEFESVEDAETYMYAVLDADTEDLDNLFIIKKGEDI